jgi:hypothetical protein
MTLRAKLGYTAAGLTVLAALLTPFMLTGIFAKGFAALGLHVDEVYSGGPKVRTLQNEKPFVQLDWSPVSALPPHVSDLVDVDGDGQPDIHVSFDVPSNPKAPLSVNVEPLNSRYEAMRNAGKEKYSRLIVRVDNAILVRVPLANP